MVHMLMVIDDAGTDCLQYQIKGELLESARTVLSKSGKKLFQIYILIKFNRTLVNHMCGYRDFSRGGGGTSDQGWCNRFNNCKIKHILEIERLRAKPTVPPLDWPMIHALD